jgi:hypothetical protein
MTIHYSLNEIGLGTIVKSKRRQYHSLVVGLAKHNVLKMKPICLGVHSFMVVFQT